MKNITNLLFTALFITALTGCGGETPEVVEETNANPTEVQKETSNAQSLNNEESTTTTTEPLKGEEDSEEKMKQTLEDELATIYFAYDKFNITPEMQVKVEEVAKKLQGKNYKVRIEGNCDEFGSDQYNYALGLRRSESVKKALIAQGLNADDLTSMTYGESNPVCTDGTDTCYAKNRRVEFKLLP